VLDRPDLLGLELAAHLEHDRCRRLGLVAREQRAIRHDQMDARDLDAVERADGARQFAFERAQAVDVLDERGRAQRIGLVEDLVADAAALGQAALGEGHAQPRHPILRHQDGRAFAPDLIGNGLAFQVLDDGGGVLDREFGEQRYHHGRGDAHDQQREEADQGSRHRGHGDKAGRPQRLDEFDQSLHPTILDAATRLLPPCGDGKGGRR
jgi:hypothetical protein